MNDNDERYVNPIVMGLFKLLLVNPDDPQWANGITKTNGNAFIKQMQVNRHDAELRKMFLSELALQMMYDQYTGKPGFSHTQINVYTTLIAKLDDLHDATPDTFTNTASILQMGSETLGGDK